MGLHSQVLPKPPLAPRLSSPLPVVRSPHAARQLTLQTWIRSLHCWPKAPQRVLVPENNTVPDSGFQADLNSPAATLTHVLTSCDCCSSYLLNHLLSPLPVEPAPGISRVPPLGPRSNVTSERWAATSLLSDLFKPAIVTSLCCSFIRALKLFIYLVGRSLSACSPG